jgi:glutamyl-tRNA synthetase
MSEVRTRFAPSPTGYVHVGSLRTALYNYLFARRNGGKFVLRVEDTDQNRFVEGAVENLLEALSWNALEYDEGPEKEGEYGPYFQSQRTEIYRKHIHILLEKDLVYPCFCSPERLQKMREDQQHAGVDIKYDRHCLQLAKADRIEKMKTEPYVVRLKIPEGETRMNDIVRGEVIFENKRIDDQVLLKADGFPTYHLANVVDDHLMKISHVIRGEEWLPSAPKHVVLYEAFGWALPKFAHLPLLLNHDRSKLSKRQGDVAVEDYRSKGILPEALLNFVALLGWNKGDNTELFSLKELIDSFSLERVGKAGAIFDFNKLKWFNGYYIRSMNDERYYKIGLEWMHRFQLDSGSEEKNKLILAALKDHLNQFDELEEKSALFFKDDLSYSQAAKEILQDEDSVKAIQTALNQLQTVDKLDLNGFKNLMSAVQKESGVKGKKLWQPIRAALTGLTSGPELPAVVQVMGKEKIVHFFKKALKI